MNDTQSVKWITPDWPAPLSVKSLVTTRQGGESLALFDGFNLALHVGDNPIHVMKNREQLQAQACLPSTPFWLNQQHTIDSVYISGDVLNKTPPIADASWTDLPGLVSVVMTADCLPILVTNHAGSLVCAIHAGWKGLADGIVEKTLKQLPEHPKNLLVWIGPAISQKHFEVGMDVYQAFCDKRQHLEAFFEPILTRPGYFLADLVSILKFILHELGVNDIYGGHLCSYADEALFYSYRRDGKTGRMASLIWLDAAKP
ncbi:peptidoglycan editing factor PgeF [Thiosulfativibrio zosterae]|uniref:Purine nucleoside phosphorylase n=1 Tax=Thiosulfativibrio zosterae TaxID=2675053 RepID=A0A6F8PMR6_9GAMM|nr:peptidoglycan editing factor PgeF [Thiosulfativibrio zosterae]BBP43385.1 laccase domain protein [Thiosulfativibrio zosterae]